MVNGNDQPQVRTIFYIRGGAKLFNCLFDGH